MLNVLTLIENLNKEIPSQFRLFIKAYSKDVYLVYLEEEEMECGYFDLEQNKFIQNLENYPVPYFELHNIAKNIIEKLK